MDGLLYITGGGTTWANRPTTYIYIYVYMYVSLYLCLYISIYIYIYTYISIHKHMYIYIYIYIHKHTHTLHLHIYHHVNNFTFACPGRRSGPMTSQASVSRRGNSRIRRSVWTATASGEAPWHLKGMAIPEMGGHIWIQWWNKRWHLASSWKRLWL